MKKIILITLFWFLLLIMSISIVEASFSWSSRTLVNGTADFQKPHGLNNLLVKEEYYINPFLDSTIVRNSTICNGGNCPCGFSWCTTISYSVDGQNFVDGHPKIYEAGTILKNWTTETSGIVSRIDSLERNYTQESWVYVPNQNVRVVKYYNISYRHDTTPPSCWEVRYYDDINLTRSFSYTGWWLNTPKYFTMVCRDSETWCQCAADDESCQIVWTNIMSSPELLWHKQKPKVSFTNRVNLHDPVCEPGNGFIEVLYDTKVPVVHMKLGTNRFNLGLEVLREYELNESGQKYDGIEIPGKVYYQRKYPIQLKAGPSQFDISLRDLYLEDSLHGVSGIQSYEIRIERETDQSFQDLNVSEEITSCYVSETFNPYNISGDLTESDIKDIIYNCSELTHSGRYKMTLQALDFAQSELRVTNYLEIYPGDFSARESELVSSSRDDAYANNSDTYRYSVYLKDDFGNPLFNREINNIYPSIENYNQGKQILTDAGTNALKVTTPFPLISNDQGEVYFELIALKPWVFTQRVELFFDTWDDSYTQNGAEVSDYISSVYDNSFLVPLFAQMRVTWPWSQPEIGKLQNYEIELWKNTGISDINNGLLHINADTLPFSSEHVYDIFDVHDNRFSNSDLLCSFQAQYNAENIASVLETAQISAPSLPITYTIWWEQVTYGLDEFSLSGCQKTNLWLSVEWLLQSDGKSLITGQEWNFSDISISRNRNTIREKAFLHIRWMSNWDEVWWVKYVEGDISIDGVPSYETLIVKNGNVFIAWDLWESSKKLGIIVLQDRGYQIEVGEREKWNIYIGNTVENIWAVLYADWALFSANQYGVLYGDEALWNKLHLYGSLLTRNTIGWWISAGSEYILPWGSITTELQLAQKYDLNYTRKVPFCWDDYSFKIIYDPKVQQDPPKGFEF